MRREGSSVGREFSGWLFQSRYHYMQSYTISYTLIQQVPTSPRLSVTPVCYVGNSRYMRGVDAMHGSRALKGLEGSQNARAYVAWIPVVQVDGSIVRYYL